jgi:hypothetical protein
MRFNKLSIFGFMSVQNIIQIWEKKEFFGLGIGSSFAKKGFNKIK